MEIGRVPKFRSLFTKVISYFYHNKKLLLLFVKYTYEIIFSCLWLKFLTLSFLIIVAIFLSTTKLSNDTEDSPNHSSPFVSLLELYPLSYKVSEEILDGTYSFTNTADEIYTLTNIVAEEDPQEFIPRIVHLELTEGATGRHDDFKDSTSSFVDVKLLEGVIRSDEVSVEFHGYDGYDEDNDDEGDNDDVDSIADDSKDVDDLHIRVDEFIAKNIMKWKEEMMADKIRYLEY